MDILAYKPGHDGHVCVISSGKLQFSIEAEKDSGNRYGAITPELMIHSMGVARRIPDLIAESGWQLAFRPMSGAVGAGYFGTGAETILQERRKFFGADVGYFSSSHERSHLLGSYGMSPFPQGQPCYALVWEGVLGHFYRIDEHLNVEPLGSPMDGPGHKYGFLYGLADRAYPADARKSRREDAGKLMALAGLAGSGEIHAAEQETLDRIINWNTLEKPLRKADFRDSPVFDMGLDAPGFHVLARALQRQIFARFEAFAESRMSDGLPLLVSGGCGLNCDWNSDWRQGGIFSDVFVQPCANDSGSAIGTAIDAQWHHTGNAKIDWSVYAGEAFVEDEADLTGFAAQPCDANRLAEALAGGDIIAWVQGRYEIGPRALGNRSLVAAPFTKETHRRLNAIKKREDFRPIAPIMMEEEQSRLLNHHGPSPHMLYFQTVRTDELRAVTHVDGSARAQTVTAEQNPKMHDLLTRFRAATGYGVLCNTSLNFNGKGFINRMSDLVVYARMTGLDGFVVGNTWYRATGNRSSG